jgi:hypothetical protein
MTKTTAAAIVDYTQQVGDLPIVHASSKLWLKLEIIILN